MSRNGIFHLFYFDFAEDKTLRNHNCVSDEKSSEIGNHQSKALLNHKKCI